MLQPPASLNNISGQPPSLFTWEQGCGWDYKPASPLREQMVVKVTVRFMVWQTQSLAVTGRNSCTAEAKQQACLAGERDLQWLQCASTANV